MMDTEEITNEENYVIEKWWHRLLRVIMYGSTLIVLLISGVSIIANDDYNSYTYSFEPEFSSLKGKENICGKIEYIDYYYNCGGFRTIEELNSYFLKVKGKQPYNGPDIKEFYALRSQAVVTQDSPMQLPKKSADEFLGIKPEQQEIDPDIARFNELRSQALANQNIEPKQNPNAPNPLLAGINGAVSSKLKQAHKQGSPKLPSKQEALNPPHSKADSIIINYSDWILSLRKKGWTESEIAQNLFGYENIPRYKKELRFSATVFIKLLKNISFAVGIGILWYAFTFMMYKVVLYIVYGHTKVRKA